MSHFDQDLQHVKLENFSQILPRKQEFRPLILDYNDTPAVIESKSKYTRRYKFYGFDLQFNWNDNR